MVEGVIQVRVGSYEYIWEGLGYENRDVALSLVKEQGGLDGSEGTM